MTREDLISVEGEITAVHTNGICSVKISGTDKIIKAKLAGKFEKNKIRVATGDVVRIELHSSNLESGRIEDRVQKNASSHRGFLGQKYKNAPKRNDKHTQKKKK
jgi:translation initiation factor IF-1